MQSSLNLSRRLEIVSEVQEAEADGVPSDKVFTAQVDLLSAV